MKKYIIVRTFCSDKMIAEEIEDELLGKKLVAGVQRSLIHSKYWWKGMLEHTQEYKLVFRTTSDKYDEIANVIKRIHNYDVCEISAVEIIDGTPEFFKWIDDALEE